MNENRGFFISEECKLLEVHVYYVTYYIVSPVQVWGCLSEYQIQQLAKYVGKESKEKDMIFCWHV